MYQSAYDVFELTCERFHDTGLLAPPNGVSIDYAPAVVKFAVSFYRADASRAVAATPFQNSSNSSRLFSPQRHHRIDARSTARRKITGQCGDGCEDHQHPGERDGIGGSHSVEKPAQRPRQGP